MAYRDDLAALETRRAALQKELEGVRALLAAHRENHALCMRFNRRTNATVRSAVVATVALMILAVGGRAMLSHAPRLLRIDGTLVGGSLTKQESPCEYRFRISGGGKEIPVHYASCVVPDTFLDLPGIDLAVMAEGELRPDGSFAASNILAKTPSGARMRMTHD